jgi:di/tricarboxylate transporter
MEVMDLAMPEARPFRRAYAPIVILFLAGVVILSALGLAPIFALSLVAVAGVLLLRCIDADEAFASVDGRLLALIFAMLGIGAALQQSGAVALLANSVAPMLHGLPPFFVIWAIYLLTSLLTELVSNNAVAVVVTPIAIALAGALGIEPRPLVVAVMVAASASFATPIGYQTNTLVYGPGGYSFTDFLKIGVPLNITVGLLASALIPLFWDL